MDIKVTPTSLQATGSRLRASGTEIAGVAGGPPELERLGAGERHQRRRRVLPLERHDLLAVERHQ